MVQLKSGFQMRKSRWDSPCLWGTLSLLSTDTSTPAPRILNPLSMFCPLASWFSWDRWELLLQPWWILSETHMETERPRVMHMIKLPGLLLLLGSWSAAFLLLRLPPHTPPWMKATSQAAGLAPQLLLQVYLPMEDAILHPGTWGLVIFIPGPLCCPSQVFGPNPTYQAPSYSPLNLSSENGQSPSLHVQISWCDDPLTLLWTPHLIQRWT